MSHILHVGLHKTGTTSLQAWLRDNEQLLLEHGYHFPNGLLQLNCHFELGLCLLRRDRVTPCRMRGLDWMDQSWCDDVLTQVGDYLERHPSTILSCEELSLFRYPQELAALRRVVGKDAQIVAYFRNPDDWLASMRDEVGQYSDFSEDPEQFAYLARDSWQLDYDTRLAEWAQFFPNTIGFDYDALVERERSIIPAFLRLLDVEPAAGLEDYYLNRRGTKWDGRVPGTRWSGGRFGDPIRPTTTWQHEFLRRRGLLVAA